jgi:cytoskeletal protein CcmA (bactofilin family)
MVSHRESFLEPYQPGNSQTTVGTAMLDEVPVAEFRESPAIRPRRALMEVPKTGEFAHIGKSVVIKGELTGSEDLYLDGQVEGSILLKGNNLTVGPNGQVKANVDAKGVIVQGKLEGNLHATDRVELKKSAIVMGDIATQRIAIEEGAYLKGKVDVGKDGK